MKRKTGRGGILTSTAVAAGWSLSLALHGPCRADPLESLSEPVIPEARLFDALRTTSPFRRTLNISDTYVLRAVATFEDEAFARVYNRDTGQTVTIQAGGGNESGLFLVEVVEPGGEEGLSGVMAKVSFAGEVAELRYDPEQLAPPVPDRKAGGKEGEGAKRQRGPTPEERERYNSLSPEVKERFHDYIRQTMKKYPDMSREERGNIIRGALQKLSEGREIELPSESEPSR